MVKTINLAGYFNNINKAEKAIAELKKHGITAYLDLNDKNMQYTNGFTNLAGTSINASLSGLVLNSGNSIGDIEKAPLYAADPSVSGMGGFDEIISIKHKIIVDTNEGNWPLAMKIIEKIAGSVI
ncbi:hypothetical protein [Serpentinicella alkaliphila]|uniref:Uncharacterized protein n=1 Tax=Serpentinicella alkaliphila TaxID=1734049 RepID=A0A4R2TDB1_9FIRM|nr:hypothetical protein [Serpentinicella alkaliphila]QUH25745.1 hypothetical protein HZR23_08350 [Serpentinicella alkaliphila]TCP99004.1 hypothetical protein EDD79_10386 [Serpentinicella alkaliphila]